MSSSNTHSHNKADTEENIAHRFKKLQICDSGNDSEANDSARSIVRCVTPNPRRILIDDITTRKTLYRGPWSWDAKTLEQHVLRAHPSYDAKNPLTYPLITIDIIERHDGHHYDGYALLPPYFFYEYEIHLRFTTAHPHWEAVRFASDLRLAYSTTFYPKAYQEEMEKSLARQEWRSRMRETHDRMVPRRKSVPGSDNSAAKNEFLQLF